MGMRSERMGIHSNPYRKRSERMGISGVIRIAEEHYAAAADVRRELAALGAEDRARKKKGTKKKGKGRGVGGLAEGGRG